MERQTQASILKYGAGLPAVDEVRILHIEDPLHWQGHGTYHVPFSDGPDMIIVSDRTLSGNDAQDVADQWRSLQLQTRYMAGCYDPHHVVQFRAKGKTICEAVVCFMCGNTSLPAFPITTRVSFEYGSEGYQRFQATIEGFVGEHTRLSSTPKTQQ